MRQLRRRQFADNHNRMRAFEAMLDSSRGVLEQKVELHSLRRLCARGELVGSGG